MRALPWIAVAGASAYLYKETDTWDWISFGIFCGMAGTMNVATEALKHVITRQGTTCT
jgi:hypothetical protein